MTAPKKLLVALLLVAVGLVFAATGGATGKYTDPSGDNGSAPDLTGVTVSSDKASGQIIFRIDGKNISSSENYPTFLDIDSDANPLTGDVMGGGEDYFFVVDNSSYWFAHWNGSDWVDTSSSTVRVFGTSTGIMISVNKSDLGNSSNLNFSATAFDWPNKKYDSAPDDGMYNYSLDDGGPSILAVVLQTSPASGPKAGKPFVVTPTGLTLPPTGGAASTPAPESYTCTATLNGRTLAGSGTGACTFKIAKKKTRGKTLKVSLTVTYEGTSKTFPYVFKVK